jgi:hypothetical protein
MKTKIQPRQIKQIFGLLPAELRLDKDLRADFIAGFTDGRASSTKELTSSEADSLIASLRGNYSHFAFFDKNNKQHLAVLNICYDLGWTSYNRLLGRSTADLNKLGTFIASARCPVRKKLLSMTRQECSKLITALEGILKSNYRNFCTKLIL